MIRAALLMAGLAFGAGAALAQSPAPAAPRLTPGMSETGDGTRPGAAMGGMAPAAPAPGVTSPGAPAAGAAMGGMAARPGGMMQGGMMGGGRSAGQESIVLEKGETRIAIGCGDADLAQCMTLALQAYERMNTPIPPVGAPPR